MKPDPQQFARLASAEYNDIRTSLARIRGLSERHQRPEHAARAQALAKLVELDIEDLCEEAGIGAPIWPREEVAPTMGEPTE